MQLLEALSQYGIWRVSRGGASIHTWKGESPGLRHFVEFIGAHHQVAEVTDEQVGEWWDQLALAERTKGTRLSQLRAFFRYCRQRSYTDRDPTGLIRARSVPTEPRQRLDATELLSLLYYAKTARDRALLSLAMNLGLRGGEIQRLCWNDVDFTHNTIRVEVDKTAEVDIMPMTAELATELGVWQAVLHDQLGRIPSGGDFMVCSQHIAPSGRITYRPERPVSEPFEVVKAAMQDAGMEHTKWEGVHTIRRSIARIYFDKVEAERSHDSALLATMTLLHHSRPETTLTYIGRDKSTDARDEIMRGQSFLPTLADSPSLHLVGEFEDAVGVPA